MKYLKLKFLLMFFALAMAIPPAWAGTVTDVITAADLPAPEVSTTNFTYTAFTDKHFTSDALYSGNTANYNGAIVFNNNNSNKGIFTTVSGGKVKSVTIEWYSGTANDRKMQFFGKNEAYTSIGDLYSTSSSVQGTKIAEIQMSDNNLTQTVNIEGDYQYIGIRCSKSATNVNKITIVWETEGGDEPPTTDPTLKIGTESLTINDSGTNNSFTVKGENLVDNIGVTPVGFEPTLSATVGQPRDNWDNGTHYFWFERDGENVDGTVAVNYTGTDLYAEGTITMATKKEVGGEDISKTVNVTYRPDIYIIGDFGNGWNFNDASHKMTFNGTTYTATVEMPANSYFVFARKLNETGLWDDGRSYFGPNANNWPVNGTVTDQKLVLTAHNVFQVNNAGEYIITINPTAKTFSITSSNVANIAEAQEFDGTFTFTGTAVVTYQKGNNLWIIDESGSGLIYGNVGSTFVNGNTLATGWKAKYTEYNGIPEFTNPTGVTKDSDGETVEPVSLTNPSTADVNKYVSMSNVTVTRVSGQNYYIEINGEEFCLRDNFNNLEKALEKDHVYNVIGVVTIYNNAPQLYLISANDVTPERAKTPTFSPEAGTYYETQNVTIACETEDAVIRYTTDGSDPTENSTLYTAPIAVGMGETLTIKAIAMKDGMDNSTIAEATYTVIDPSTLTTYRKVTNTDDLTDGNYLIVSEGNNAGTVFQVAFNGSLETLDATSNRFEVTIADDEIKTNIDGYFTINVTNGTIKSKSGKYIGQESDANGLKAQENALTNTISIDDDDNAVIKSSGGAYLRYNATSGQERFRYFKSSTYTSQKAIQLYKEVKDTPVPVDAELSYGEEPVVKTATVGDEAFEEPTLINPHSVSPITYSSNKETVATVNAETGEVTIVGAGTAIITASFEGNDEYLADEATYTINVNHKALTITLDPESKTFTVGDEAKVKVDIDNVVGELVEDYKATYTYNGEEKTLTLTRENGYITLPNDKAVTYNVTATVMDERMDDVTATGTYTFTALPAITFDLSTDQVNYTVGDVVKVKATDITGTFGEYDVTYMIGETQLIPDNDGYVTFTSDEVGDVTLTVTVEDLYEHESAATQEITFHFAAGGPISITLTADPEAETYTVGDVVNVKVTTNGTIGNDNDVLITYTTDFESKAESTYDPKKGIDITSDKAGDVTLTVNVYDGYAHEGADENGITTKTADYTFVKAPAINITFDPASGTEFTVGQEAKVKVTIAGAADDYEAEYKIGDNVVEPVDGYIVLPNTATDDVTLTVSVYDGIDRIGADESGFTTATATYIFNVVVAAPTFTPEPGSYTAGQTVNITCPTEGAVVSYSTDGGSTWTAGNTVTVNEDMTLMAKAVMNGVETTANAVYSFEFPVEPINIEPLEGYYQIKNNGNGKYAYVQGRRTLNFTDAPADKAGTVIYVKTDSHGQVQSLRSQAADLQGYADKAMNYVPELVHLVAQKLETEGVGELFGETGVDAILAKFDESFDHHLYVEPAEGGYRIYGKTPSMQPVVEFYRENQAKVDAKLPMLEEAINNAIDKILEKTNGSGASILTKFSVDTIWKHMNNPYLIEPVDDASTMAFYHQVLMNKDYVWSFAYETAMIYWTNLKKHPRYENEIKPQLGEFAQYLEKIEQVRPNFKYYIAQKNDKPDFISQGNVDVNQPRNIWTVEPRANFVVNVPEANKVKDGYVTTLYTDFAYTLPEGVTAYKVTAVDENGYATTEAIGNAVPAQTPVLLKATAAGDKELTLNPASRAEIEVNLLKGPDYLIGEYQIKNPTVEKMFNLVKGLFGEEIYNRYMLDYEHLMLRYAGLMNNKYFWGLSEEDVAKCVYTNEYDEEYCVVRSLDVKDGEVAFYDNSTVSTNKAFLVTETLDKIMLEKPEVAAPTFTPEPGSYTEAKTVTIGCATEGATILYSTDGGNNWTAGNTVTVNEDMTLMAKAVMNGVETTANAVYSFEFPVEPINIEPLEGYYQIKNNGNGKYAYVQGRRTLNFTDAPDDKAGTVIYVKTDGHGQVQSLRSQAADLQGYADKAMNYVPELVHLVAQKLETEGVGELFGETGVDAILAKFDESFDHHLYVEPAEGGYRIYGKTPSMQPVVEFYRENQAKVDAKLPMLEDAINNAIDKILEKTNGSGASILEHFSLHTIWEKMNDANLIEPTDDASTMAFYHQVLMNKDYVWSFAYETAMIYWTNLKSHPRYENEIKPQLGEFAQYLEKIEQVRPNFKYYIAQKNDKPDFISQGNVDVNQPRNIWTVEPRTDFTMNIAGEMFGCPYAGGLGGYVTSLYTDFAYTLPEGVTAYKVTAVKENGQAELTALEGVVPAQTPVLLIATAKDDYTLTLSTEAGTPVENNLLKGPDYLIGEYQIKNPTVEKMFNLVKGLFGEEIYNRYMLDYEHLMLRYAGLVNNKYFWGLSEEDVAKCVYTNEYDEEYCVVRSLDVKDGEVAFYDNSTVSTNKAFLVTETLDKITLDSLRGDVNHDGDVNIKDVSDLIDRLLGNEANSCPYCSDVNCDDDVNIKDVSDLIDFLLNSGADTHVDTPTTDPEGGE